MSDSDKMVKLDVNAKKTILNESTDGADTSVLEIITAHVAI